MSRFDEFFLDLLIFRANFEMFLTNGSKKKTNFDNQKNYSIILKLSDENIW